MSRGAPGLRVVRSGAGPQRAARAASRLNGGGVAALAVAGVGGGLVAGLAAGTVVIGDRVLADDGREVAVVDSAALMAGHLRRLGLPVAVGGVVSTPRVARGRDRRAALARLGAVVVDTETAYALGGGYDIPTAVVRVVVDTPERELFSTGTFSGGVAALRHLRRVAPALSAWADCVAQRTVLLAGPRSFCAGVERAIATVERALDRFGTPIYVRRQIVHNRHVVEDLEERGAIFVRELSQVPDGATVILSAHGVSPEVRSEAAHRDLQVIDATCPLVSKVHHEVRRFSQRGYQ
ncbi:MAG: 4-hydroxy-3-methylbut-2-enyl diphosphate reductase, partial [Acidobacteriota bacterium]|nr:4-hydroxy-3-methylbut-2-enyl diphosphate reductase [Acidobacteriota bacterium]